MQTIIKFTKNIGPYSPGDSAGFEDNQANSYIDGGFAELVWRPDSKKAGPAPDGASSADDESQGVATTAVHENAPAQYGRKGRK